MPWKSWPVIVRNMPLFQKINTIQKSLISYIIFVWEFQQALADISDISYTPDRKLIWLIKLEFQKFVPDFFGHSLLVLNPLIPKYLDLNSPNLY